MIMKDKQFRIALSGPGMADVSTRWLSCGAKTLHGAKTEATRRLGNSFTHRTIHVGIYLPDYDEVCKVASRSLRPGCQWKVAADVPEGVL